MLTGNVVHQMPTEVGRVYGGHGETGPEGTSDETEPSQHRGIDHSGLDLSDQVLGRENMKRTPA